MVRVPAYPIWICEGLKRANMTRPDVREVKPVDYGEHVQQLNEGRGWDGHRCVTMILAVYAVCVWRKENFVYATVHLWNVHCGGVQYCYDQAASLPTPTPNPLPPLPDPVLNTWLSGLYTLAVRLLNNPSNSTSAPQDADAAMELITVENVRMQVESTSELDVVQKAWNEGKDLRIVGWLHQLENGRLKDLGICAGPDGDVGCSL
ncbi:hypothetical protein EUX98_g9328 [Antrodiella citrinella]|uniref:Carbonic anhydrase n=1 Tax=Antrodiella citrinella TaxID=2447956 RepID=A0A4S4LUW3_9APHY|nr:hypothetical protein EUX98_g9328 [Antrodiella citrinella]